MTPGAPRHFAWQAWHKLTSTFVSRGRRGTNSHLPSVCVAGVALMVLGGALGPGFGACDARGAAALCVAGVAQTHIYCRFAWQAWHKLTSTVVLRGRRGTNSHPPSFCVAGVAQTHIHRRFAWQAWHRWHGVARHFAWQAWLHLTASIVFRHVLWSRSSCRSCCSVLVALAQLEVADIAADSVTTTTTTMISRQ